MNNILSLKTVGLSYASTNLSFAFALYFNISMFLLYHNPPLFSITRRTCPNVFLFGVQIPVDACPLFGSKRRSFLFVIDKKQPQPRLFLYTGESVRFDKNAHCFAVEPLGYPQRAEGTHRAAGTSLLPKAKTSHHRFCVHSTFVFSPRKNRPKYGRFFVVWIYCFC